MADFSSFDTRSSGTQMATNFVHGIRNLYAVGASLRDLRALYLANTNPDFNAIVDTLYTPEQIAEIEAVGAGLDSWLADVEANHRSIAGLPPAEL